MDDIDQNSYSSCHDNTCDDITALLAQAKEALLKNEANAPITYFADDTANLFPEVTAQTIGATQPLVLPSFAPDQSSTTKTTQSTSA